MSAKALTDCNFEPATEQTIATDVLEGRAAETQFREDLWREYRLEAINAGFGTPQATEYASALTPEMGWVAGGAGKAHVGTGWFYHCPKRVVTRTINSGLIALARWKKGQRIGRGAPAGKAVFAPRFRAWNPGTKG